MEGSSPNKPTTTKMPPLHIHKPLRRATFNHLYMVVYTIALLTFFYYHLHTLLNSPSPSSFILSLLLLLSDFILAFMWLCNQAFHFRPIRRQEFPENLERVTLNEGKELPAVDIFICTADPYKEPPMGTVNTALSVMAYDYPPAKVSVYVSDDGGAQATLFAFMEAAKFARHWLPFCRENNVKERCPEAYFNGIFYASHSPEANRIKTVYESMKVRVETAVEQGKVPEEYFDDEEMLEVFAKWSSGNFIRQDHPTVIQVLLSTAKDKDVTEKWMPNLIYVSREKSKIHHHMFKAGALNALVRVSATMTNAPVVLTLDCDTYSNDPQTVKRALCYFCDPEFWPILAYVQFPQIFRGLNKGDIYFSEHKRLFQINPLGMDGLSGPNYVGTGCFFRRRAFFGGPSSFIQPIFPELSPDHVVVKPIGSPEILELAHCVAACNYEKNETWGIKMGFRYGSLVEDYHTGYRMQCEGWKSIFCNPQRPAFLGDAPVRLIDMISQCKRWMIGLLDVLFSRHSITYGIQKLGLLMGFTYTHYAIWPIHCIPLTIYAFIPQLALLKGVSVFPEISDPRFLLYLFLFIGANAKDILDFILEKGTLERWWNSQRMWMICGLSSFLFGCIEYTLGSLGIAVNGFELTSKLQDDEQSKRYDQGRFEFGVASPMFLPMTMAAIINLVSFVAGSVRLLRRGMDSNMEGLMLQIMLSGFVVINCKPIYEAILFRSDKGRMPTKLTFIAAFLVSIPCACFMLC